MNLNIDVIIFIGFLVLNLLVGLSYGSRVKTIKDYALGGRNFSTATLVSTIVATFTTGSSFFVTVSKTYSDGLPFIVASLAWCIQFFILGFFLIPRMGEFMGALSVAEVMGNLYDKRVRLITAVSGILWNVGGIAVQFKVFGNLFNYFLGIPGHYAILIASTIVIIYSAFGGIKAVTYTDMLQFLTFGFVIPIIGIIIWDSFHFSGLNFDKVYQNPLFSPKTITELRGEKLISFIFLVIYFSFPKIGTIHFQRISMGCNIKQVKTAFLISHELLQVVGGLDLHCVKKLLRFIMAGLMLRVMELKGQFLILLYRNKFFKFSSALRIKVILVVEEIFEIIIFK